MNQKNVLKSNPDESHLLAGDEDNLEISIGDVTTKNSKEEKLLGITVSSDFSITKHVSNLCSTFSNKSHAFARISHFMSLHKRRNVMKACLESEFGYCPLVWIFHGHRSLNSTMDKLPQSSNFLCTIIYRPDFPGNIHLFKPLLFKLG